jgi:hypothetical protein
MNASAILSQLADRGVTVSLAGDKLRCEPASRMTAELIQAVRRQKVAIILQLQKAAAERVSVSSNGTIVEKHPNTADANTMPPSGIDRLMTLAGSGQTILPEADDCDLIPIGSAWSCPTCGSYAAWQDLRDGWHCLRCEEAKFERSLRLLDRAEWSRRRLK